MQAEQDTKLVRKALDGDPRAFEALVETYYPRIYRVCLGVLGKPPDAEDCVQDTFMKVFRSLKTFNGKASFYTWLYRIAMNTCYDYLRKNRSGNVVSMDVTRDGSDLPMSAQLADAQPTPDEIAEKKWTSESVRACILQLPENSARILWMRDIEGFSYTQIAQAENIREGTVKSRLFRGREQLGRLLEGLELF